MYVLERVVVAYFPEIDQQEGDDAGAGQLSEHTGDNECPGRRQRAGIAAVGKEEQAGRQSKEHERLESACLRYGKRIQQQPEKADCSRKQ